MNIQKELTIPFDTANARTLLIYTVEFLCVFLLLSLSYMYFDVINDIRRNIPVAILDVQGVRTHRHGVIA